MIYRFKFIFVFFIFTNALLFGFPLNVFSMVSQEKETEFLTQRLQPSKIPFALRLQQITKNLTSLRTSMDIHSSDNRDVHYTDLLTFQLQIQRDPPHQEQILFFQITEIPNYSDLIRTPKHSHCFSVEEYAHYFLTDLVTSQKNYDFKIFEGTEPNLDHLLTEVVTDDHGSAAEIIWVYKGSELSGSQSFQWARKIIAAFQIPFTYLFDAAKVTYHCGSDIGPCSFTLKNYSAFLFQSASWYQKIGDYRPLKFFDLTPQFFFQSPTVFYSAIEFLKNYRLIDLQAAFAQYNQLRPHSAIREVLKNRHDILQSLIQKSFPMGLETPNLTLEMLVKQLAPRTQPDPEQIIDFYSLYHTILKGTVQTIVNNPDYKKLNTNSRSFLSQLPKTVRIFDFALEVIQSSNLWYEGTPPFSQQTQNNPFNFKDTTQFTHLVATYPDALNWEEIVKNEMVRLSKRTSELQPETLKRRSSQRTSGDDQEEDTSLTNTHRPIPIKGRTSFQNKRKPTAPISNPDHRRNAVSTL